MKLVKIFGVVMAVHAAVFMFIFAIPGCRSTGKKSAIASPVAGSEASPVASTDMGSPIGDAASPAAPADVSAVRFSPTRPGTPAATEVTAAPAPASYTVVKGDNLWSIAKKHGVTVKQLTAVNNMRTDAKLKLGQKLVIPGASSTAAAASTPAATAAAAVASAPAASSAAITHVVKSGETLGGIARKYQVKVGEIATANNIADPTKLRVGQSLKIPGWQAPASKSSATPTAKFTPAPSAQPAPAAVAPAPVSPLFGSPLIESTPATAPATEGSPFITPAPAPTDAPLIRVEESGAPKIE